MVFGLLTVALFGEWKWQKRSNRREGNMVNNSVLNIQNMSIPCLFLFVSDGKLSPASIFLRWNTSNITIMPHTFFFGENGCLGWQSENANVELFEMKFDQELLYRWNLHFDNFLVASVGEINVGSLLLLCSCCNLEWGYLYKKKKT